MSLHASWVHGSAVQLERPGAPSTTGGMSTVRRAFAHTGDGWFTGDILDLGGYAGIACLRIGWAARFVAYDHGTADWPKSGYFWCHYPVPTPVIQAGSRARAQRVLINYSTTHLQALAPAAIHVWDGNRRIFADNSPEVSADDFNGGIAEHTTHPGTRVATGDLWPGDLGNREVFFGLAVSIRIHAHRAREAYLEIRSVGIDFDIG